MTTELKHFKDAYATMIVAVYEPLIMKWYSKMGIWHIANLITQRIKKLEKTTIPPEDMVSHPYVFLREKYFPTATEMDEVLKQLSSQSEAEGKPLDVNHPKSLNMIRNVKKNVEGFPNLEINGDNVLLDGSAGLIDKYSKDFTKEKKIVGKAKSIPIIVANDSIDQDLPFDVSLIRGQLHKSFCDTLTKFIGNNAIVSTEELRNQLINTAKHQLDPLKLKPGFDFLPVAGHILEALSPIGVAHFYRQLYFNHTEGVGPLEQAFTVAPAETLEVVYETIQHQVHEESIEIGSETISEIATENKNINEVSDKVSSMIQRDTSAAMSTSTSFSASGGIGVWSASASGNITANTTLSQSHQRSSELANRRLKEITKRASERITKSYNLRVRNLEDITATNVTRRIIKNEGSEPISYGLRRVYNRIKVKVQDLGPQLVWQLYVSNPGEGLARGTFAHFSESKPTIHPADPPAIRLKPVGGIDTGVAQSSIQYDAGRHQFYVEVTVHGGQERVITALSIDSVTDLEGGGKDDKSPAIKNNMQWDQTIDEHNKFSVKIAVVPSGDSIAVALNYTYSYEPGSAIIEAWEEEKRQANAKFAQEEIEIREKALREEFERHKSLITEKSKIRPRPSNDLRREERYEVLNRMISHIFGRGLNTSAPSPLEIEFFHRYFDIESMFVYTHPSWWKPRYAPFKTGLKRPGYEITADSEPAPMGSSLGWLIQLDGDTRRNEFINSPWVRICLPMRPNREREAIAWLAKHVDGEIGYDPKQGPLKGLLEEMGALRSNQDKLGINGPDYVTVDSTIGAPSEAVTPEDIFPIINEFEVTIPTEGFVYDPLKVMP